MTDTVKYLSPEARRALIDYTASRPGVQPPRGLTGLVAGELQAAGLVTEARNLTARGASAREIALDLAVGAL